MSRQHSGRRGEGPRKGSADRYQSMREMVVDLRRLARAKAEIASAAPTSPGLERRRRRWGRVAGIAAAILLVAAGVTWQLWKRDYFWQNPLANARSERVTDFDGEEVDAAISPDGKFTVFVSDRDGRFDVWVTQIGTGLPVNITKGRFQLPSAGPIRVAGFSGDGAQVWFLEELVGRQNYMSWRAPAMGGDPHPFIENGMNPVWSPDGTSLAYHTPEAGDPIFIADRNGSNPRRIFIASPGVHCHYLTWSPDGHFIYFVRGTPTTEEMDFWRIPVSPTGTTATPERITSHNARVAYLAWLDARTLIYSATAEDGSGQWLTPSMSSTESRTGSVQELRSSTFGGRQRGPPSPFGHLHHRPHRQPVDGPHLGWRRDGGCHEAGAGSQHACARPPVRPGLPGLPVIERRRKRTLEARKRSGIGALERRRRWCGGASSPVTRR